MGRHLPHYRGRLQLVKYRLTKGPFFAIIVTYFSEADFFMTKKVSMKAYFSGLSNARIQEYFADDGFDVKVVNQKSSGVWVKFKDKADASMFILQYDTMENYVTQLEVRYPWFEMRPYQKQMIGRALRKGNTNVIAAGRRTGKSMMTKQYFDPAFG